MKKEELKKEVGRLESELEHANRHDRDMRIEIGKVLQLGDEITHTGSSISNFQVSVTPSWYQIFAEIGNLQADCVDHKRYMQVLDVAERAYNTADGIKKFLENPSKPPQHD